MEIWEEIKVDTENGAKRLVAEFWDRLFGASLVLCKDEHIAEDLVFRTFTQVIIKIDQYDDSRPFWNSGVYPFFDRQNASHPDE